MTLPASPRGSFLLLAAGSGITPLMALVRELAGPLYFNFARQSYDAAAWQALLAQGNSADLAGAFRRLFDGEKVNVTEDRAALHTALRGRHSDAVVAREAYATALDVRQRMAALISGLEDSGVTDIVSVGIGGSDLGPRLVADALRDPLPGRFRVHFLSNVDGAAAQRTLAPLDPARTAAVLISKTFGTQETLLNGGILRDWLGGSDRLYAVSANPAGFSFRYSSDFWSRLSKSSSCSSCGTPSSISSQWTTRLAVLRE